MEDNNSDSSTSPSTNERKWYQGKTKEIIFLGTVTGISTLFGFSHAIALTKKKDSNMFTKGLTGHKGIPESGGSLALRALGWGTLYSVGGFTLLCFSVCKLMGVKSMEDFRNKMQNMMPKIPKKEQQGKSDFKTVRELVNYIIDEDGKKT